MVGTSHSATNQLLWETSCPVRSRFSWGKKLKRFATIALTASLLLGSTAITAPAAQTAVSVAVPAAKKTVTKTAITTHPRSITAVKGSTAKFSVSTKGHKLKYQWQLKTSKASAWKNVPGATGKSLTLKKIKLGASKNQYGSTDSGVVRTT